MVNYKFNLYPTPIPVETFSPNLATALKASIVGAGDTQGLETIGFDPTPYTPLSPALFGMGAEGVHAKNSGTEWARITAEKTAALHQEAGIATSVTTQDTKGGGIKTIVVHKDGSSSSVNVDPNPFAPPSRP